MSYENQDISSTVNGFFSKRELLTSLSLVSKAFNSRVKDPLLWVDSGAINQNDFEQRVRALAPMFQDFILTNHKKYNFSFIENIVLINNLTREERIEIFFSAEQMAAMPSPSYISALISPKGVLALCAKLITPEQASMMPDYTFLSRLLSCNGLKALLEDLITPEQVVAMNSSDHLIALTSDHGLVALRDKLISTEQALLIRNDEILSALMTGNGIKALRKGYLTPADAARSSLKEIHTLLLEVNDLELLDGLCTPAQATAMPSAAHLCALAQGHGPEVLRERLITPEEASLMELSTLCVLMSDDGIQALRKGSVTSEQAIRMPFEEVIDLICSEDHLEAQAARP